MPYFLEKLIFNRPKVALISNEQFSSAYVGQILSSLNTIRWWKHRANCINALQETFPQANIIVALREPSEYVRSLYSQYIVAGGDGDLQNFWGTEDSNARLRGKDLEFLPLLQDLGRRFNVFPYTYEEFAQDKMSVFKGMQRFFEVNTLPEIKDHNKINYSLSDLGCMKLREYTRQCHADGKPIKEILIGLKKLKAKLENGDNPAMKGGLQMPYELKSKIKDYYRDDWSETCKFIKMIRSGVERA
mgnify:CR=1 FL=1